MTIHLRPAVRSVLSPILMSAVLSASISPPEHLHRAGVEGRTEPLVHAHSPALEPGTDARRSAAIAGSHGDHRAAVFLGVDGITVSRVVAAPPATLGSTLADTSLEGITVVPEHSGNAIHGPPRTITITRGPPSVA